MATSESICLECRAVFTYPSCTVRKYCSRACWYKVQARERTGVRPTLTDADKRLAQENKLTTPKTGHLTEILCDQCGKAFINYLSRRQRKLKFCSRQCCFAYQKGYINSKDVQRPAEQLIV